MTPGLVSSPTFARRIDWAALAGLLVLLLWLHWRLYGYAADDAYIHLRIAQHLAEFGLPYFNVDLAVMGSSSTGWTLLLALIMAVPQWLKLHIEPAQLVTGLNALVTGLGAVVYTRLLSRLLNRQPGRWVWLYTPVFLAVIVQSSLELMETSAALLLAGIGLTWLLQRNPLALVWLTAAAFFRMELLLLLILVAGYAVVMRPWAVRTTALLVLVTALPFVWYMLYFFGTVIPHTVIAKRVVYSLDLLTSAFMVVQWLLPGSTVNAFIALGQFLYAGSFIAGLIIAVLVKCGPLLRRRSEISAHVTLLILAWGVLTLSAYVTQHAFIFSWYAPLFSVPLSLVTAKLFFDTHRRWPTGILLLPLLMTQLLGLGWVGLAATVDPGYYPGFQAAARVRHYLEVGHQLYQRYPAATLMTSEIGGLGYSFEGKVVDGAGLVSPEALRWHPLTVPNERSGGHIGAIPVGFILEVEPELIVSYDMFIEAFLQSDATQHYQWSTQPLFLPEDMAHITDPDFFGGQSLNIFIRNDVVISAQHTQP